MSLLTKAAGKFDAAFSALPPDVKQRVGLAIYRFFPTLQQCQKDLEPLSAAPGIKGASWDLLIAFGFRLMKKQTRAFEFSDKELTELGERAPEVTQFLRHVQAAIDGRPMLDVAAAPERKKLR